MKEAKKAMPSAGHVNVTPLNEDKPLVVAEGATVYSNKVVRTINFPNTNV